MKQKPRVLFGILNWGLGHASRSIPIIQYLQEKGYEVIVCSDGYVLDFIRQEVQDATFETLPGYNMHYKHRSMALNMMLQAPKLYYVYSKEKKTFRTLEKKYTPDFCISDNRYGCNAKSAPSFFISHQWNILGSTQRKHGLASRVNQYFIKKFSALFVPDDPVLNITGLLTMDIEHKQYDLGLLSRFEKKQRNTEHVTYHSVAILSGPEPNRTTFEHKLIAFYKSQPKARFALIRGTDKKLDIEIPSHVDVFHIVDKDKIQELVYKSEMVICRSGYSSVMDFLILDLKRVLYVPTSGQTEQEYLAKRLRVFHGYESLKEEDCNENNLERITEDIRKLESTERTTIELNPQHFRKILDRALRELVYNE